VTEPGLRAPDPKCLHHRDRPSVRACDRCTRRFCENCLVEILGSVLCENCKLRTVAEQQAAPGLAIHDWIVLATVLDALLCAAGGAILYLTLADNGFTSGILVVVGTPYEPIWRAAGPGLGVVLAVTSGLVAKQLPRRRAWLWWAQLALLGPGACLAALWMAWPGLVILLVAIPPGVGWLTGFVREAFILPVGAEAAAPGRSDATELPVERGDLDGG
jgi:hypothetical protein